MKPTTNSEETSISEGTEKSSTSTSNAFSFLTKVNPKSTVEKSETKQLKDPSIESKKKDDVDCKDEEYSDDYLIRLKCLNKCFLKHITKYVNENDTCDLSPVLKDYFKYLEKIDKNEKENLPKPNNGTFQNNTSFKFGSKGPEEDKANKNKSTSVPVAAASDVFKPGFFGISNTNMSSNDKPQTFSFGVKKPDNSKDTTNNEKSNSEDSSDDDVNVNAKSKNVEASDSPLKRFTFGASKQSDKKDISDSKSSSTATNPEKGFTFGATNSNNSAKFSFGTTTKENSAGEDSNSDSNKSETASLSSGPKGFSFGSTTVVSSNTTPKFSFGSSQKDNSSEDKNSNSAGDDKSSSNDTSKGFSFASIPAFGSAAATTSAPALFSFGTAPKNSSATFSFGSGSASQATTGFTFGR